MVRLQSTASAASCAVAVVAILVLPASAAATSGAGPAPNVHPSLFSPHGAGLPFPGTHSAVCGQPAAGQAACLVEVLHPATAAPAASAAASSGLSPAAIKSVYGYTTSNGAGAGETIALVDAYNDPDAASDLNTFSAQYGLPTECTAGSSGSCFDFAQVNQSGGSSLPANNASWDLEISLDIEWAHALAPAANILLVEASSATTANLLAAEQYAGAQARYVSNSWGGSEFAGETADDSYFTDPGVSYFAAAGDTASAIEWPSTSPDVISVGGSSLAFTSGGTLASETAWSDGGGGCSQYELPNSAQMTGPVSCSGRRATPDVSLDADPNSGVSVYDSVSYEGDSGWWVVGGTSASTAMWAGVSAAAGGDVTASYVYASPAAIPFRDVIAGSNGHAAGVGYDLATGLGTWSYTPGPPTNLTATSGSGGVTLRWSAPTGAAVTQYAIWRGTASGQETTQVATVAASGSTMTYTDTSASGSGTYYYEVQPVNGAGVGPFSNEAQSSAGGGGGGGGSTPPVASFSGSCSGASCSFSSTSTDSGGTISSYAWNGGNGVTGHASIFNDTYTAAGAFTVTLQVTNTAGQSSTASAKVSCTQGFSIFGRGRVSCT